MTTTQREAVRKLIREACRGTLYWVLVKLNPGGEVEIKVNPWSPAGQDLPPCLISDRELHHLFLDWADRFSDHVDQP